MKTYTLFDQPIKVSGVPFFEQQKRLARLPDSLMEQLPQLAHLGRRCAGGRAAFKTDSPVFRLKVTLKTLEVDIGMSLYSCQGVQVMVASGPMPVMPAPWRRRITVSWCLKRPSANPRNWSRSPSISPGMRFWKISRSPWRMMPWSRRPRLTNTKSRSSFTALPLPKAAAPAIPPMPIMPSCPVGWISIITTWGSPPAPWGS
ncbi:MAG: hypothetical protein E7436_01295 [Ruminococcaceae bacterium]|nr:hypothetical protein [Oscillospiraceae bacterium]